jgi:hypothetical protein
MARGKSRPTLASPKFTLAATGTHSEVGTQRGGISTGRSIPTIREELVEFEHFEAFVGKAYCTNTIFTA